MAATQPERDNGWNNDQPEYSLWVTFQTLLRYWYVGLAVLVLCWIGGAVAYKLLPRVYEVKALLAPAKDVSSGGGLRGLGSRLGGLASLAGVDLPDQQSEVNVALALLQSQGFLQDFLAEQKALDTLFPDPREPSDPPPTLQDGYLKFRNEVLVVLPDKQSGLVEVRVRWTDPKTAMQWCNTLVTRLNVQMRATAAVEAEKSIEFLNRELAKTPTIEIRQSIYQLIESQVNQLMIANVREDYVFRVVDPPHQPDADRFVSPSLVVVVSAATLIGALLALCAMVAAHLFSVRRAARRSRG